jgi:hypothetical protein
MGLMEPFIRNFASILSVRLVAFFACTAFCKQAKGGIRRKGRQVFRRLSELRCDGAEAGQPR